MRDENDTKTADLLDAPVGPVLPTVTVAGFGTGTVAELEMYLDQLRGERDALKKEADSPTTNAALALYDAVSVATNVAMVDLILDVEAQADDISELRAALHDADREISDLRDELREMRAELGDIDKAGEMDGPAIWAAIDDRVEEAAADAARQVIRDELVVSADLI